ncbi:MAG: hypothetical protein AAF846_19220 [Chloroflexota bacterium]
MNDNISRILAGVLAVGLVVLGIFTFNQNSQLTDTQDALTEAETIGTQVADSLNQANTDATALADQANEASTQASMNLADANAINTEVNNQLVDANATATQAADEAATSQRNLQLTATRSAVEAAGDIVIAQNTAQANADALTTAQAEATELAENVASTATEQSNQFNDVVATVTEQSNMLADASATETGYVSSLAQSDDTIATQAVEIANAQATIDVQSTALAIVEEAAEEALPDKPEDEEEDTDSTDNSDDVEVVDGLVSVKGLDFTIAVPEDYFFFDLRTDQDDAIDTLSDLGLAYSGMVGIAQQGPPLYIAIGFRDEPNPSDGTVSNLILTIEELPSEMTIEDYIEQSISFLPSEFEVTSNEVLIIDGEEVGRLELEAEILGINIEQLGYIYMIDDTVYFLAYTVGQFDDDLLVLLEASALSFEFTGD